MTKTKTQLDFILEDIKLKMESIGKSHPSYTTGISQKSERLDAERFVGEMLEKGTKIFFTKRYINYEIAIEDTSSPTKMKYVQYRLYQEAIEFLKQCLQSNIKVYLFKEHENYIIIFGYDMSKPIKKKRVIKWI